ncbi:GumC family protein [Aureimonas leprariae]|nr:polysaccharide biosynthesis tyrosine autokinase [Aureimonas leprariae]
MIAITSVLLTAAAAPVIWGLMPTYRGEARLMLDSPLVATLDTSDLGRPDPLNLSSETERLLSRATTERVIHDLHLSEREEFNPALRKVSAFEGLRKAMRGLFDDGKPEPVASDSIERIIPEYHMALSVRRDGLSNVIQIGFESRDPELAAAVPNALIGVYLEARKSTIRNRLNSAESWIHQRTGEQQARVDAARAAAASYRETAGSVSSDAQAERIRSIAELGERHAKIMEDRAELEATIAALKPADGALPQLGLAFPAGLGEMERDLFTQQRDLDQLLQTYGDNAEQVVDMRGRIRKARSDFDAAVKSYLKSQTGKLAAIDREAGSLRRALAVANQELSRSNLAEARLTELDRASDREQTALDKLEELHRKLVAQATFPGTEVEILSPASVPLVPQGRGRLPYMIGALLASISVAVTAAFVREMMDKTLRSADQLEDAGRIDRAGLIPRMNERARRRLLARSDPSEDGGPNEAIRAVVASIEQANGGRFPASLVVTSAHAGEGKSFLARSLAMELASTGHRVLLVDADRKAGTLGKSFDAGSGEGLNEFLAKQACLDQIVRHQTESGIDFIPRGRPVPHRPADFGRLAEIVEMGRAREQVVIFDSAAALGSMDTVRLAGICERTVLVVRWAKTGRRAVEAAFQRIRSSGRVFVTMNKVKPRQHSLYMFDDHLT